MSRVFVSRFGAQKVTNWKRLRFVYTCDLRRAKTHGSALFVVK